jgi:drug/metabolite transporter (DMT)-like permease
VVVFSILCDIFIWRKVFTVRQRLALGLLAAGVLLVSLNGK